MSADAEARGLAEPFTGITTNGTPMPGLFALRSTGVSTAPVRLAAEKWLASLTADQRARASFGVDDPEWRKWMNQHFYVRQGVSFEAMTETQRAAAFGLLRVSLSARGLTLTRDIMKLNHTLGELNNNDFEQYGEWLYFITVMGDAVGHRAVGMAARWPSRHHQLLRHRGSGRDDADLCRIGTRHRRGRQL